jgi:hypothetical protein
MHFRRLHTALACLAITVAGAVPARAETCQPSPDGQFGILTYCASSVLPPQGARSYGPLNAYGDRHTAWVEGAPGDGIGEWLKVGFDGIACFRTIIVRNGYGRNAATFRANGRVRRMRITTSDGLSFVTTLPDRNAVYRVRLPRVVKTASVRMTILSVYRGARWRDTAVGTFLPDLEELNYSDLCR